MKDKEIVVEIMKRIGGDVEMRKKKDLIESFIASLKPESNVDDDWNTFIAQKRKDLGEEFNVEFSSYSCNRNLAVSNPLE